VGEGNSPSFDKGVLIPKPFNEQLVFPHWISLTSLLGIRGPHTCGSLSSLCHVL
jgi:hypothetical protein